MLNMVKFEERMEGVRLGFRVAVSPSPKYMTTVGGCVVDSF